MEATVRLFRAVPIESNQKKAQPDTKLLARTIRSGFVLSDEVVGNYSGVALERVVSMVEKEIGLNAEQMNSAFHKSWQKVRDASIEQLLIEQLVHYFTTYGFERLGIEGNFVYVPVENLDIPDTDRIKLTVIKGYTKAELKTKVLNLLRSGMALSEATIKDVVEVAFYVGITPEEIESVKNKEVRVILFDMLDCIPRDNVEFLRYAVYTATNSTLLIKNGQTIEAIKTSANKQKLTGLFLRYEREYGLARLAEIFLRFKPLFLAFRGLSAMNRIINKIRKLAITNHKPMAQDYLNEVTARVKRDELDVHALIAGLAKANIFRKIRLANALKYRLSPDNTAILYKVRNGRGYATDFSFANHQVAEHALTVVLNSIAVDLEKVDGKRIYIPDNVYYAMPATEKQFTGMFPSGTYVTIPKDTVVGIYWENTERRIDLDLSLVGLVKYGWDSYYRDADRSILFSGDMTDATHGASELYYVAKQEDNAFLLMLNFFNYRTGEEVPFKLFVAQEHITRMQKNYLVDPANVVMNTEGKIAESQKVLGLLVTAPTENRFYFSAVSLGNRITSRNNEYTMKARQYLRAFHKSILTLNEILSLTGCKLVSNKEECDIDLSPESLTKDTFLELLTNP